MTYSTHAKDAETIGLAPASPSTRSIRRRRHNLAMSHHAGGIKILGFGF